MKKIRLVKKIYLDAFQDIGNVKIQYSLKIYSCVCFSLFCIALYAFIYRLFTGYNF